MLVSEPMLTRVIDELKLNAEDFYLDRHREIYASIHDLYAASKPVELGLVVGLFAAER